MADHHLITDLLPARKSQQHSIKYYTSMCMHTAKLSSHYDAVGRIYFAGKTGLKLSAVQGAILIGMALQYKTVDMLQVRASYRSSN